MSIPKGGRGKSATYKTIQVRCPEPVKPLVVELIRQFHEQGITNSVGNPNTSLGQSQALELNQQIEALQAQLEEVKAQRDELDKEVNRLTAQTGVMDLTVQNQALEIADLKKAIASQPLHSEVGNKLTQQRLNPGNILNQLRQRDKKSKASIKDIEAILDLIEVTAGE